MKSQASTTVDGGAYTHILPMQVLANTRQLIQQHYSQIPQLSVGGEYDLNQPVLVSKLFDIQISETSTSLIITRDL
jgi:hypothetical protein